MITDIYLNFVSKNWKLYGVLLVTLLSLPLQKIAMPHFYGKIIDALKSKDLSNAKYIFGIILFIWIGIQLLGIATSYVHKVINPKMNTYIRKFFFDLIVDRYNQEFQELKTGEIHSKLHDLPWILDDIFNQVQNFFLNNVVVIVATFIYLVKQNYLLGLIYIASIFIVTGLSYFYVKDCDKKIKNIYKSYEKYFEEVDDTLQNLLSVYTNKKIGAEKYRMDYLGNKAQDLIIKSNLCDLKYKVFYSIFNILVFVVLNYTAYRLYVNKQIDIPQFVSIFIINFTLLGDLIILYYQTKEYIQIKGHIDMINNFLNKLPKIPKKPNNRIGLLNQVDIKFENIKYRHKDQKKGDYIYNNFNFHIPPNQDITIMGHIGSGKSTFSKLLVGLYKQNSGNIYLNGINTNNIHIDDIRNNIIYIPQHPQLFNRTLWANIVYGLPEGAKKLVNPNMVYEILQNLGMYDLSDKFKERMHENVGKKGSHLSGGQRQIVWILRCIFQKCPVIILDEPTSSLDAKSKQNIMKMIRYLQDTKTVIIITHDTDLINLSNRLIELKDGKIIKDQILNN